MNAGRARPRRWLLYLALLGLAAVLAAGWALNRWYTLEGRAGSGAEVVDIPAGAGVGVIARRLAEAHVISSAGLFTLCTRLDGRARRLKAGEYSIPAGASPRQIADLIADGRVVLHPVTLVEGWTVAEVLEALSRHAVLKQDLPRDPASLLAALGRPPGPSEGRFYPDTYAVARGTPASTVLKRAYDRMEAVLADAWTNRDDDLPFRTSTEALVLASIIEKETAAAPERPLISAVFCNRLRIAMRLQTDPTVIYGLGPNHPGPLHHEDLLADTPYNTYTRAGLPPTPIALPGRASIEAAVHPAASRALYFVALGDGSGRHAFSETLALHNEAVSQYVSRLRSERAKSNPP